MKGSDSGGAHRLLTERIIGAAIEVHRILGPGLLESSYEECLDQEIRERGMTVSRQVKVPLTYKGRQLASSYRLDLLVENIVIVEIKAVDKLAAIHQAQMLSYLRHTGRQTGLILNFNTPVLVHGIKRVSL
jgi:GxxExxY protein